VTERQQECLAEALGSRANWQLWRFDPCRGCGERCWSQAINSYVNEGQPWSTCELCFHEGRGE
jgi:hypothetical protein